MRHLYVHIPFCRSRCSYCDFAAEALGPHLRAGRVAAYLTALRTELDRHLELLTLPLETIYVGGGTPTALPHDGLLELVTHLASLQRRPSDDEPDSAAAVAAAVSGAVPRLGPGARPEFTLEANPGTIDATLLAALAEAGVTRLSLGVQSFSPALRAALGRRVTQDEIDSALAAIHTVDWREWNLDLVFGIPGQDWAAAVADLEAAVSASPAHISLYDLTYTPDYAAAVDRRSGAAARGAAAAFSEEHYAIAVRFLETAGYRRYEVSNFALPGHECRHNLAYWQGEDYVGLGAAAVSTYGRRRRTNPATVSAYLEGEPPEEEHLSDVTRTWERAMLGLRTAEGVDESDVAQVLDQGALERLLAQGCLERCCGKLRVNPGFMDVNSSVLAALLATPYGD